MSGPIYYDDVEYPNVEAMSAAVRAAYEADVKKEEDEGPADDEPEDGDEPDEDDDNATQAPAWAGAQAGATVPVPPEFAQVTGLGPAVKAAKHKGVQLIPHLGPPRVTMLVRYRDGLAYHAGGKEVHTLVWEDVTEITSHITYHAEQRGSWTDHEYTLTKKNGEKLILDDELRDVYMVALAVKQAVYALLRPPALQRYKGGQALTFGPVTAQKQSGLQVEGKPCAWNAIQDVRVHKGRFQVTLTNGQKHEARASAIPNIELLCQFIGVKLDQDQLAYEAFF